MSSFQKLESFLAFIQTSAGLATLFVQKCSALLLCVAGFCFAGFFYFSVVFREKAIVIHCCGLH